MEQPANPNVRKILDTTHFVEDFQEVHPKASLILHDVTPEAIPDLLLSGTLDGAFCTDMEKAHEKLDYLPFSETMAVAFPDDHSYQKLDVVPLRRIPDERYFDRLHCEFRNRFMGLVDGSGVSLNIVFSSQREDWIQSMAGVSVIPEFHNVYVEPSAFAHFQATREWPEGTQIVKEPVRVKTGDNCDTASGACREVSGVGYFMSEFADLELTIKDSKRFPDKPGN